MFTRKSFGMLTPIQNHFRILPYKNYKNILLYLKCSSHVVADLLPFV